MKSFPARSGATRLVLFLAALALATGCEKCKDEDVPGDGSMEGDADATFVPPPGCNDGDIDPGEACDDGNNNDGDGCSRDCATRDGHYICPTPGTLCIRIITCGNAKIEGDETCDDQNTATNDGCDADCHLQNGWTCPNVGAACVATECGDGIVAGFEACDDDNAANMDGCSSTCQLEDGSHCPVPGAMCQPTNCGDTVVQGTEDCDDGNDDVGDGCDPFCRREPSCANGTCVAVCGDGVRRAPEACDDGNTIGGDGCAANCATVEHGFTCTEVPGMLPGTVSLPVTYRDFIANCDDTGGNLTRATSNTTISRLSADQAGAAAPFGHRDMDCFTGSHGTTVNNAAGMPIDGTQGGNADLEMVQHTLDSQRKPVMGTNALLAQSAASFAQWFRTTPNTNLAIGRTIDLALNPGTPVPNDYFFDSATFFPLSNAGWMATDCNPGMAGVQPCEAARSGSQNFFFTSEAHFWFQYKGTEILDFRGDDDVWVFIDGKLVVDIGGVHGPVVGQINIADCNHPNPVNNAASCISDLSLLDDGFYEVIVFQAERHVFGSNYRLTLTGFVQAPSVCVDDCGDGIVSSREACDLGDGMNGGVAYGGCTTSCTFEPYCGDGTTNAGFGETCDDGINLGGQASACAPGCMGMGAVCGDGVVQTVAGEQCDDRNMIPGDGCSSTCQVEIN